MKEKLQQFENKSFVWQKKTYCVKEVFVKNLRAVIITDRRSFVWLESQLDEFIMEIGFFENTNEIAVKEHNMKSDITSNALECEIIEQNGLAARLTEKLEGMFDLLEVDSSDQSLKKAKSMVDIANAIVNVQNANYRFLMLRK